MNVLSAAAAAVLLAAACSAPDAVLGTRAAPPDDVEPGASATTFARVDLGTLGGASSYAADINDAGIVVGWSQTASGASHAFRWTPGRAMEDLGTLPGHTSSRAIQIRDGSGPGDWQILGMSDETPVAWTASGTIIALPIPLLPGTSYGYVTAINTRGEVVGWDGDGSFQYGWIWSAAGGKQDLFADVPGGSAVEGSPSAVSDAGVVLLTVMRQCVPAITECWRAYFWSAAKGYVSLSTPGGDSGVGVTAAGMNLGGTIVVGHARMGVELRAVRWEFEAGWTVLPTYPGEYAWPWGYALAVNARGTAVGAYFDPAAGSVVPTMWPAQGGITRLSPSAAAGGAAVAVNSQGVIAGWLGSSASIWVPDPGPGGLRPITKAQVEPTSGPSASCLVSERAIRSRQALFACVAGADAGH